MENEPEVSPMPEPAAPDTCPHCGTAWRSKGTAAAVDDAAVCQHCLGLLIRDPAGWRAPSYDEAELWDRDPRVQAMRKIWAKDDPGPDGAGLT